MLRLAPTPIPQGQAQSMVLQPVPTRPPWGGVIYSANPEVVPLSVFQDSSELVPLNETLTYDFGWRRVQGPTAGKLLPLGSNAAPFPGGTSGSPILLLDFLPFLDTTSPGNENVAITAKKGGNNGTVFVLNDATGDWQNATADGAHTIGADGTVFADSCVYPLASVTTRQGIIVFTTGIGTGAGSGQTLYYYPSTTGAPPHYALMPLPTGASLGGGLTEPLNLTNFQCASVVSSKERLGCLNTVENGVNFPTRYRFTTASWSVVTDTNNWYDPGAGVIDLVEFEGVGLRALEIGDRIALYFEDGVAFLDRTGDYTIPYARTYLTKHQGRGLLASGAITDIGGGVHFGIYTDGFYLLTQNGDWTEVGTQVVSGTDAAISGQRPVRIRKWTDYFFANLNYQYRKAIVLGYDETRKFIYLCWPDQNSTGTANRTWLIDLRGDRVFPLDWSNAGATSQLTGSQIATDINRYRTPAQSAASWNSVTPSIWNQNNNAWASYAAVAGLNQMVHGTASGFIWAHDPNLYTRDGNVPIFYLNSYPTTYGSPIMAKSLGRRWMEYRYFGPPASPSPILASLYDGSSGAQLVTTRAWATDPSQVLQSSSADFHCTATSFRWFIFGSHPIQLFGWTDEVTPAGRSLG